MAKLFHIGGSLVANFKDQRADNFARLEKKRLKFASAANKELIVTGIFYTSRFPSQVPKPAPLRFPPVKSKSKC